MQKTDTTVRLTPGARLWRNKNFNIFWFGQTLSVLGDAFAIVAIPLLVLQATGSVVQMGLVTAIMGVGQIVMGVFAGFIVDRIDRRRLMIFCDMMRAVLYLAIPIYWWVSGPQIWLIFVVTGLGACLGMTFQITYVAAIANLVDQDQITEANGRTQVTYAIAYVTGPVLAGVVSSGLGSSATLAIDAASFGISALTILFIRLHPLTISTQQDAVQEGVQGQEDPDQTQTTKATFAQEFLAGLLFLWQEPTLRAITIMLMLLTLLTAGTLDLFMFRLKHDLQLSDNTIGIIFGLASIGSLFGGLLVSRLRRAWGFGVCFLGGFILNSLCILLLATTQSLAFIAPLAIGFTFGSTIGGATSMSLRQEVTPNHLLGRVTSAFWMIGTAPGPLGAALFTALTPYLGTSRVLAIIGGLSVLIVIAGILTPIRQRYPERNSDNYRQKNITSLEITAEEGLSKTTCL